MSALIQQFISARSDTSLVVLEGFHAIKHALRFNAPLLKVVVGDRLSIEALIQSHAPDIRNELWRIAEEIDIETFRMLAPQEVQTPIVAIAKRPHYIFEDVITEEGRYILLDQPSSPNNTGAVIRVAAAARCASVIVLGIQNPFSPAAGLQFALPIFSFLSFSQLQERVRIPQIIAFDERGNTSLDECSISTNAILAFGSERSGLSSEVREAAIETVQIPMREGVSSLNLATSVAAVVYHK